MGNPETPDSCGEYPFSPVAGWAGPDDSSDAEFYQAAKQGNLEKLRAAMTPDLDLNLLYGCVDANIGETALHAAVRENHVHIVKFLIESGANIEMERRDHIRDLRPLHEAAKQANPDMVRILLDAGADIQAKFDNGHGDDGLATSLVLRHMEHQQNYWPQVGQIEQKHLDTIELLLSRGIDINAQCGSLTMTLLESAIAADSVDLARALIARGAALKVHRYEKSNRLIQVATEHNATTRTLEYVMGELGIKDPGVEGLFNLAYYGPCGAVVDMARMLFDAAMTDPNRDPNFPNTEWVQEQLREAACHNNLPIVQFLLDRGVDVNGLSRYGESPLLAACLRFGDVALLKLLLERGADKNHRFPKQRHYASGNNACKWHFCAPDRRTNLEQGQARRCAGEWGDTPYNVLRLECFRLLAESCRDIDAVDSKGMSAMHLIACNAKDAPTAKKAVDLLIQNGANPNIRDHEGVTGAARLQAKLGIELDLAAILGWVVL
ncbi:hypothetical protein RB594_002961 [Gaeumannomyces avenae]